MVGFTSDEVQEAVNRFLFREVSVPRLKTGARDTLAIRDVIYDLVTTTLLLRTDSYFYLVYLAKNALRALVAQQIADLSQLDADAPNASRPAQLIDSTTDLTNAQAAILNVNAGLNSRRSGQGVRGSIGPAVDRFRRSVARFVSTELSKNVVSGTEIVETGEEVQAAIETTFAAITARHAELTQRAALLEQGTTNLASVSLPQSSVQGIVSRIQTRLAEVQDLLEGDSAIAESRGAFLELLTMRSLLTKASTFENPRQVLMPRVGDSSEVTLVDSGGVEARIAGTTSGPFNYAVGTQLDIVANGTPYTVDLPRGGSPEIRSVPLTGIFPWPPLGSTRWISRPTRGSRKPLRSFLSMRTGLPWPRRSQPRWAWPPKSPASGMPQKTGSFSPERAWPTTRSCGSFPQTTTSPLPLPWCSLPCLGRMRSRTGSSSPSCPRRRSAIRCAEAKWWRRFTNRCRTSPPPRLSWP
jgi:hypothetical protein